MAMDYCFKKRFSFLLNKIGKRGIKFLHILKRRKVERIYHFSQVFFHFFPCSFMRLKNICDLGLKNFIKIQKVINEQSIAPFLA